MPDESMSSTAAKGKRLVLCFDGTGNKFLGNASDTNVVKIYQLLDRNDPNQYHYYQPGIGTYTEHKDSNSSTGSLWNRFKSTFATTIDQMVGTSFVSHVLAGYRFVMRYYNEGDQLYILGFSRGAYTARFLSEMLLSIGLLSKGNEEMIRFAWDTFSDYQRSRGNDPQTKADKDREQYMQQFKETFCRPSVEVYFLGLFDCVNSVSQFEVPLFRKSYQYIAQPSAKHIRHAVSIHERRLKFKPALFNFDEVESCDIKEVWFAGNHADVGGGWDLKPEQRRLLSDNTLEWMLHEVLNLPGPEKLAFRSDMAQRLQTIPPEVPPMPNPLARSTKSASELRIQTSQPHDMLAFGGGVSWLATLNWWILELLPFFSRLELQSDQKWVPQYWPPNLGCRRDIPLDAAVHTSVRQMYKAGVLSLDQMPRLGGEDGDGIATLLRPLSAVGAWQRRRKVAGEEKQGREKERRQRGEKGKGEGKRSVEEARRWDGGGVEARRWAWDE